MDPATLSAVGTAAGGLGSLVSGLGGLFGGKKTSTPNIDAQYGYAHKWREAEFRQKMNLGKEYGFHPLTMLGAQVSSGGVSPVFDSASDNPDIGESIERMGAGVSRAANAYKAQEAEQFDRKVAQAQLEGIELENAGKLLANQRAASELRLMNSPGTPPRLVGGGEVMPGSGQPVPAHQLFIGNDGKPISAPSQAYSEAMEAAGFPYSFFYGTEDFFHNKLPSWWVNNVKSSNLWKKLNKPMW